VKKRGSHSLSTKIPRNEPRVSLLSSFLPFLEKVRRDDEWERKTGGEEEEEEEEEEEPPVSRESRDCRRKAKMRTRLPREESALVRRTPTSPIIVSVSDEILPPLPSPLPSRRDEKEFIVTGSTSKNKIQNTEYRLSEDKMKKIRKWSTFAAL
jgi:hypothetical protein